ncbi:hypothetical protein EBT31_23210 [bacterium]|jgi:hypothetical protein|nr:hypothetical protein [bacterium]
MERANKDKRPRGFQYCFRAVVHMTDTKTGRIVGTFTGFDKSPRVATLTIEACRHHLTTKPAGECLRCGDPELTFFAECPSECSGDITFVFHREE